jgi:hypothetical protein
MEVRMQNVKQLASMNNSYFYEYVQEMMPSCMKDLAKMKV